MCRQQRNLSGKISLVPLFHNFSKADSAEAGKIRTALFFLPAPEY